MFVFLHQDNDHGIEKIQRKAEQACELMKVGFEW